MNDTVIELLNYGKEGKLNFLVEDIMDYWYQNRSIWDKEYIKVSKNVTIPCLEKNKKLIFLAEKLTTIEKSGYKKWFRKIKDNPMTLEETNMIHAAYEFLFENKDIYLVTSRYFWKIGDLKDFVNHNDKIYAHKTEGVNNDLIISVSEFATNEEIKEAVRESDDIRTKVLDCCYNIPGYDKLPLSEKNALYDMVKQTILHA